MAGRPTFGDFGTTNIGGVHHVRPLRTSFTPRTSQEREALLKATMDYLGKRVEVSGDGSGTHIVLWPRKRTSESEVIAKAASRSVGVYRISQYYLKEASRTGFMLGYTTLNEDEIREGIRLLAEVL